MVTRRGFTLVEVLVSLVILEVGLLGVMGTLLLAARTLTRAEAEEEGVEWVERVTDSLVAVGGAGEGKAPTRSGEVTWSAQAGGTVRVVFSTPVDSALVVVDGLEIPAR